METRTTEQQPGSSADSHPQPGPMRADPHEEHRWLRKLLGEWSYEHDVPEGPDQPAQTITGRESVRALGEIWIIAEGQGGMPGGDEATTMMTLGYDPRTKRFVGTWIGSMMHHMWVYDGELDTARDELTLSAVGPDFKEEGKTRRYRDVITFEDEDNRTLTARVQGDDGEWQDLMPPVRYRRR